MTFQHHDGSAGPARVLHAMTAGEEFLALITLRDRTTRRQFEQVAILDPQPEPQAIALPLSGLTGSTVPVASTGRSALLFKGGRYAR